MVLKQEVNNNESCFVVHLLEAEMNWEPYTFLCNLGNQFNDGNCLYSSCIYINRILRYITQMIDLHSLYYYAPL